MPNDRTLGSTKTNINHGFVSVSVLRLIFVLMLKFAFDYLKRYFKGESYLHRYRFDAIRKLTLRVKLYQGF